MSEPAPAESMATLRAEVERLRAETRRLDHVNTLAKERADQAESAASAMRGALEEIRRFFKNSDRAESKGSPPYSVPFMETLVLPVIDAALSSSAGKDLLAQMGRMEAFAKQALAVDEKMRTHPVGGWFAVNPTPGEWEGIMKLGHAALSQSEGSET